MITREQIIEVINKLNKATYSYEQGNSSMSDKEWDDLYFWLKQAELETGIILPNSPTQKIIYPIKVDKLTKVKHNHLMLSLDKTKSIDEVSSFLGKQPYIAMCKMDGLTCSLRYLNGKLVSAETRGNGEIGENVTHNANVIKSIPKEISYKEELIIDGEIICTYENFKPFSEEYKNPRNFASGSIRLLDSQECQKRNLTFVAWDIIKGFDEYNLLLDKLLTLRDDYSFITVPCSFDNDINSEIEDIKYQAKKLNYPIDGVVFKFNNIEYSKQLGKTEHHFKNAIAYKFYDETYDTRLKYIDWMMGRTGTLTPVAVFEPVEIDGSIVERASMHNYGIMRELLGSCAYIGEPLKVFKSNQIIPQLLSVEEKYKYDYGYVIAHGGASANDELEKCPICGELCAIEKSKDGVLNMICQNPQCPGKLINSLDHFCSKKGLDIKGLSKATLEKLIDWGWVSNIYDIYELNNYKEEWQNKQGFGDKSVTKILQAIEDSKNSSLANYISAIGIPLIGKTVSKELVKYIESYEDFRQKIKNNFDFSELFGFGESIDYAIKNFDYTYADKLYNNYMNLSNDINDNKNNILQNITFVITGKLNTFKNRDAIKAEIEFYGGKVSGSISKNTKYLINNDINSTSSKNKKAKELGIPIITEEDFLHMIDK